MNFKAIVIALLMSLQLWAVNINTAAPEELTQLNGIGEKTAERIVQYRQEHKFASKEEIMNVKGIGEKTFEKIKDDISI